ncbi:MAG: hypothetical protein Q8Q09_25345 [Deltaproteobacteria bacterium]|nr:hypothetical protein [Deltaproteobacteria bacterium]
MPAAPRIQRAPHRLLSALLVCIALTLGCSTRRVATSVDATPLAHDGSRSQDAAATVPAPQTPPSVADGCEPQQLVRPSAGVVLRRMPSGPAFVEIHSTRRGRWLGLTHRALCASDDRGEHWTSTFVLPDSTSGRESKLTLQRVSPRGGWLLVHHERTDRANSTRPIAGYFSDEPEPTRFELLRFPLANEPPIAIFGDGLSRMFAATEHRLFRRDETSRDFEGPFAMPGRLTQAAEGCGRVLIARSRVDQDGAYWFRSFDQGARWSPFRLGILGVDSDQAVVRCLGARGGIEAGRGALPSHWSFDGGRTWSPSRHDDRARSIAREQGSDAVRCAAGPADEIACHDPSRVRLLEGAARDRELYAPALCDEIRQVDTRTTVAFGASCGLLVSRDYGGLWSPRAAASVPTQSAVDEGRGGFVGGRVAWRLNGGVWWTTDAGRHWSPTPSVIGRTLERGVFVDSRRGVFSTRTGWVVSTGNGGRSWRYVIRGDVERISTDGQSVFVTTPTSVRVSPNGGGRWLAPRVGATSGARLKPWLQREGQVRFIRVDTELVVEQRERMVTLRRGQGVVQPIAQLDHSNIALIAADLSARGVLRTLLSDGSVLILTDASLVPTVREGTPRTSLRQRARRSR